MNVAEELSKALSEAVKAKGGSVVRVEGRRRRPASSGVAVAQDLIVTAHHTVDSDEEVEVGLADGATAAARLVGRDPTTDVALLRLSKGGLLPVAFEEPETLDVGAIVLALSRPGRSTRASFGVVSASGESWRTPAGGRIDRYLQSDVALHPGFSGSLLVDAAGRALGLNTAGLLRSTSVTIPGQTVKRVVESLAAHGRIRRGFLGIGSYPVPLSAELRTRLAQKSTLLIVSVEPGSPAAEAGLLLGDALLAADSHPVAHVGDLLPLLEEERIGSRVALRLLRAGELKDVEITVGQRGGDTP
jgi:S1-C subfamily serine protease